MKTIICKNCGKEALSEKSPRKLFCSDRCRNHYYYHNNPEYRNKVLISCRNYYHKHKDNLEFKKKNYERMKRWIEKNRARFNELCKLSNKRRREKLKQQQV